MTELVRPAMYGSHHEIEPVAPNAEAQTELLNIVGGVCESSDWLGHDRELAVAPGDLLAVRTAGAYGMSMASTYNSRPLPMEVLVDGSEVLPLRRPMTALDLIADECSLGIAETPVPFEEVCRLFKDAQACGKSSDAAGNP